MTAAQKEDILAITRKSSPGKRLLPLLAAVAMGILAGRTASAISDMPTFGSAVFGFSVGFATLIVAIELAWSRKLMALQPLLKGLPRSAERLFPAAPLRLRSVPPAE